MRTKVEHTTRGDIIRRTGLNGSSYFNITLYNELGSKKWEYELADIPLVNKTVREAYENSPWRKVQVFKKDKSICTVQNIRIVYDGGGYVLKLNYLENGKPTYRYIQNVNSLKYLKLLKLKDVRVLEYLKSELK